jgi:hypothetical protein
MTTLSAKQVASRIGTDAKTFRKYLRSPKSPFEPVGQGGRYDFEQGDLDELGSLFWKWAGKRHTRQPSITSEASPAKATPAPNPDIDSRGRQRGSRGSSGSHVGRSQIEHDGNAARRRRERNPKPIVPEPAPIHNIHLDGPELPPDKTRNPNYSYDPVTNEATPITDEDPWQYDPEVDPLADIDIDDLDLDELDDSVDDE